MKKFCLFLVSFGILNVATGDWVFKETSCRAFDTYDAERKFCTTYAKIADCVKSGTCKAPNCTADNLSDKWPHNERDMYYECEYKEPEKEYEAVVDSCGNNGFFIASGGCGGNIFDIAECTRQETCEPPICTKDLVGKKFGHNNRREFYECKEKAMGWEISNR